MTSAEDVRRLFDVELTRALDESDVGLGFRCRFHVTGAGAWDVSLALLWPGVRDAATTGGGYRAAVTLDAAEWGSPSANPKISLVDTSPPEDRERAKTMLDVLFRGPPFAWPSSLRTKPVASALLASAPALPPSKSKKKKRNPFTGEIVERLVDPPPPMEPPVPFLQTVLGYGEPTHWYEDLVALHDALLPGQALPSDEAFDDMFPEIARSNFDLTVRAIAPPFSSALANASDEFLDALAPKLSRSPRYAAGLRRMRAFAREHAELFFWGRYD